MKKLIPIALILSFFISLFSGCQNSKLQPTSPTTDIYQQESIGKIQFDEFDKKLLTFINETKYQQENYMASPLSYRYALALLTAGAKGETQEELYKAAGFDSYEDYIKWTQNINTITNTFNNSNEEKFPKALQIANSIWHISESNGTIKEDYKEFVGEKFNAISKEISINEFVEEVNKWIKEKTNGLIPQMFNQEPSNANTVLINSLYLKSSWKNSFTQKDEEKEFTNYQGQVAKKNFMSQTNNFRYHKDENTELVILELQGNVEMAVVIGDITNIEKCINDAKYKNVYVSVPQFEIETSFNQGELVNYLQENKVKLAFDRTGGNDFSGMIEGAIVYIDSIIQKTKIKVDEKGLEATAVTAIITDNAIRPELPPAKFVADKPFSFFIYTNEEMSSELLFFGQYIQ